MTTDARGHVTGIALTSAKLDNSISLTYRAPDSYSLDVNGFDGDVYGPADKQPWNGGPYDQFLSADQSEFFVIHNAGGSFAALGLDDDHRVCFYAVGLPADTLPTATQQYFAAVDGLAVIGGRTLRLYGSSSELLLRPQDRTATIKLVLAGRDSPFDDFYNRTPIPLTEVTANLSFRADGSFLQATMSGGGYSGVITNGRLVGIAAGNISGRGGSGAVFSFELRNSQGDYIFGVIAADVSLI